MANILFVDDDDKRINAFLEEFNNFLDHTNIKIDVANSASNAKRYLKSNHYDLLILDIVLPYRQGSEANFSNGINLLKSIMGDGHKFIKPKDVVGITYSEDNIDTFKPYFEENCFSLILAKFNSKDWIRKLLNKIKFISGLTSDEHIGANDIAVVTVHGIRTYGEWQYQINRYVQSESRRIDFFHHKYGYFSILSFIIPFLRQRQVNLFCNEYMSNLSKFVGKDVVIIAHSFGTYIVALGMIKLIKLGANIKVDTLILCGSILKPSFNISNLLGPNVLKIINECGYLDIPLCLTQLFIFGTGMAGRVGFYGMNCADRTNRFFWGGHSLYFSTYDGCSFIEKYWIPIILGKKDVEMIDHRARNCWCGPLDTILSILGCISKTSIFIFISYYAFLFIKKYVLLFINL